MWLGFRDRVRVSDRVRISRIMYVVKVLGLDVCGEGLRVRRVVMVRLGLGLDVYKGNSIRSGITFGKIF